MEFFIEYLCSLEFCFFHGLFVVYPGFPLSCCRLSLNVYLSVIFHSHKEEVALRPTGALDAWVRLAPGRLSSSDAEPVLVLGTG